MRYSLLVAILCWLATSHAAPIDGSSMAPGSPDANTAAWLTYGDGGIKTPTGGPAAGSLPTGGFQNTSAGGSSDSTRPNGPGGGQGFDRVDGGQGKKPCPSGAGGPQGNGPPASGGFGGAQGGMGGKGGGGGTSGDAGQRGNAGGTSEGGPSQGGEADRSKGSAGTGNGAEGAAGPTGGQNGMAMAPSGSEPVAADSAMTSSFDVVAPVAAS